jgi:hypothetical protein
VTIAKVGFALLAGLVALVLLFPASGVDTLPPECFSMLGYSVPCGGGEAVAAGAATAAVVGLWLWLKRSGR